MEKLFVLTLLVTLGASLLEASSLEDFRNSFNELGLDIDERVQVLRAENSDAILEMNREMLRLLGNYTFEVRDAIYTANMTIQVEEWLNDNADAQECFDWAYFLMELYSIFTSWEVEWCATYTKQEISADAQYRFYSHAHYIMRAGTNGRGRVLESFGLFDAVDRQLQFLENELEELQFFWKNYQTVLKEEVEGHTGTAAWIAEELQGCLQEVVVDVGYWLQYVKDDLEECLVSVETPDP